MDEYKRRQGRVLAIRWTEKTLPEIFDFLDREDISYGHENEWGYRPDDWRDTVWLSIEGEEMEPGDVLLWYPDTRTFETATLGAFEDEWEPA